MRTLQHRFSPLPFALLALCGLLGFAAQARAQTPAPRDVDYPGIMDIDVDLTDLDQRVIRTQLRLPAAPGPMTLLYPRWLRGNHAPTGPIEALAGLVVQARDARGALTRIEWQRSPVNMHAFEITVPEGAVGLDIALQFTTPIAAEQGRRVITPDIAALQWEKALLYPAGHYVSRIRVRPVLRVRQGWSFATALRSTEVIGVAPGDGATLVAHQRVQFADTTLERLVDSPVYTGRHAARWTLDALPTAPVTLNVFADRPALLDAKPAQIEAHRRLVREATTLFASRHYSRYEFLLVLSEHFSGIGLEHHESSENALDAGYFVDWDALGEMRDLLPHEYTHSWVGKFRRPADLMAADYNEPTRNSLLWVYEGMTEFWSAVLSARSGLWSDAFAKDSLAWVAAVYGEQRPGRAWRNLQDTTNQPIMAYQRARAHPTWQRGTDYYSEGTLLWLDVDAQLRALTREKRSLDDFAAKFFAMRDGELGPLPFRFEDVVATLGELAPYDWTAFLRSRLDTHDGRVAAPVDGAGWPLTGLARAGWKLVYREEPSAYVRSRELRNQNRDYSYSIGFTVQRDGARLGEVVWDSPAFRAGLSAGMQLIAVGGKAFDHELLREAITAAAQPGATGEIELLVRHFDDYRTVRVAYRGGLRYPHLERIPGTPDRLAALLKPRTAVAPARP